MIQAVEEAEAETDILTSDKFGAYGSYLAGRRRKTKQIRISCVIGVLYDLDERARVLDALATWAQDGYLTVSYRPGKRLRAKITKRPSLGDIREWTQAIEIEFTAYSLPYWEDVTPSEVTITAAANSAKTGKLTINGTADKVPVEVTVTNTGSAALQTLDLTVGNTQMSLAGLNIPKNGQLTIAYDDDMLLRITDGTASKLSCRVASSSDDLQGSPGDNTVSIKGNVAVSATFSARGLWL